VVQRRDDAQPGRSGAGGGAAEVHAVDGAYQGRREEDCSPGRDALDILVLVEAGLGQPFDLIVLALTDQGGVDGERVLEQGAEGLQTAPDAREIGTLGVLDGDDEPLASDHVQLTELDLLTPVVIAGGNEAR
jgi:hypothetical protein